jgi:hypothetical protein
MVTVAFQSNANAQNPSVSSDHVQKSETAFRSEQGTFEFSLDHVDARQYPPDVIEFASKLNGDIQHDANALGEELLKARGPKHLRQIIGAFLAGPDLPIAEKFSELLETIRETGHPLNQLLERVEAAIVVLRKKIAGGGMQGMNGEAQGLLSELEALAETLKQQIAEDIQNKFVRTVGGLLPNTGFRLSS